MKAAHRRPAPESRKLEIRPKHWAARHDLVEQIFDSYAVGEAWDEMILPDGNPREHCAELHKVMSEMSRAEFEERCAERDRSFLDRGVTFSLSGEERPFPLDPVPRIISAAEWAVIEAGVVQRVRTLELFLEDVYGKGQVIGDGIIPRNLVFNSSLYKRQAFGISPPNGVRIHVAGIDVVRDQWGELRVLEDNVRTPSGVSYVLENRRAMTRIFPELLSSRPVRQVEDYPRHLLDALRSAAPVRAGSAPVVVVLTPGIHNSAYFEHSFLARRMGVELVEGRDLVCRNNVVYMRTTGGERRVDVVYRRVDDDFLDPVFFREDSVIGCPGILNAARAGNVTIASAVGNGVADDKLTYTYVPDLIRYYLGEEPVLKNVTTYRPEDPDQLNHILARLGELVVKPVNASGGYGIVIGPQSRETELAIAVENLRARPRDFIVQELVTLSTAPTMAGSKFEPRHIDLRPFAVNSGDRIHVLPGGLTRVAMRPGSLIVNSSQGGGSKDTWVASEEICSAEPSAEHPISEAHFPGLDQAPPPHHGAIEIEVAQMQQQQQLRLAPACDGGRRC